MDMRDMLGRAGLQAIEGVRGHVQHVSGRKISRAAIARRSSLNDATLTRGLSTVPPRPSTVARYGAAMLAAAIDLTKGEPQSLSTQPIQKRTEEAAQALAYAVGDLANAKPGDIRRGKKLRAALDALKTEIMDRFADHVRVESAMCRLVSEWLENPDDAGVRHAAIACATAIVCRAPIAKGAEAAHAQ